MSFDLHASLTGTPAPFDSRVSGVDRARLVRAEVALVEGMRSLVDQASAAGNGADGSDASAKPAGNGGAGATVKLTLSAKQDGKPFADAVVTYHNVDKANAQLIGDAFAGIDDAVAKG